MQASDLYAEYGSICSSELKEMITRVISWGEGKGGRYLGLTLPPSCADSNVHKFVEQITDSYQSQLKEYQQINLLTEYQR